MRLRAAIGVGITQLNFIGTGNTFAVSGNKVDVSIAGGGGGGIGTWLPTSSIPFTYLQSAKGYIWRRFPQSLQVSPSNYREGESNTSK